MDAGIGEAMLISAAIGGGSSAIQGRDPLQGALMGGLFGGLGAAGAGALGSAFGTSGAIGEAAAASQGIGAGLGQEFAQLGTINPNLIPTETGYFDPTSLKDITPQSMAAEKIAAMKGNDFLTSAAKQAITSSMDSGNDPYKALESASFLNQYVAPPSQGIGGMATKAIDWMAEHPRSVGSAAAVLGQSAMTPTPKLPGQEKYSGPLSMYRFNPLTYQAWSPTPPNPPYRARYASGGIMSLADGGDLNAPTGPVERLSQNVVGAGGMYPQSQIEKTYFATPTQMPASAEVINSDYDAKTNPYTGVMMAKGGTAKVPTDDELETQIEAMLQRKQEGLQNKKDFLTQHNTALRSQGIASIDLAGGGLGGYSDGGRMLKGPGDGMSDSIPGVIGDKRPARLADGEFVVPADVVSHLGNGSTDAGAKKLYGMMDRVRQARTGTKKQGRQINPRKLMPA